jgi:glucan-binding YG repeat protein
MASITHHHLSHHKSIPNPPSHSPRNSTTNPCFHPNSNQNLSFNTNSPHKPAHHRKPFQQAITSNLHHTFASKPNLSITPKPHRTSSLPIQTQQTSRPRTKYPPSLTQPTEPTTCKQSIHNQTQNEEEKGSCETELKKRSGNKKKKIPDFNHQSCQGRAQ